jgi:hypothetical protein
MVAAELRQSLQASTWASRSMPNVVESILNQTEIRIRQVPIDSHLGQSFSAILSSPNTLQSRLRNVGFIDGRAGLSAGDLKSRSGMVRAIRRPQNRGLRLHHNGNEQHPSVLGKLVEQEVQHRADQNVPAFVLSTEKNLLRAVHPVAGVAYTVSNDGTVFASAPFEFKTIGPGAMEDNQRMKTKILSFVHQLALGAFAMGVDEGVLLIVERDFSGDGGYCAFELDNLGAFHVNRFSSWLESLSDDEVAQLHQVGQGPGVVI